MLAVTDNRRMLQIRMKNLLKTSETALDELITAASRMDALLLRGRPDPGHEKGEITRARWALTRIREELIRLDTEKSTGRSALSESSDPATGTEETTEHKLAVGTAVLCAVVAAEALIVAGFLVHPVAGFLVAGACAWRVAFGICSVLQETRDAPSSGNTDDSGM